MIQYKNLDLWHLCTSNEGMRKELMRECENRRHASRYIILSTKAAHLEYEMQQMWEEELLQD